MQKGLIKYGQKFKIINRASGTSTGIGAHLNFTAKLAGNCYLAKPLTASVQTQEDAGKNGKAIREFFQIKGAANIIYNT